jgi:malate dehydrogenase
LNGEYNHKDICIGVPCVIGKNGVEQIVELDLNDDEMTKFNSSAIAVKSMNSTLTDHT